MHSEAARGGNLQKRERDKAVGLVSSDDDSPLRLCPAARRSRLSCSLGWSGTLPSAWPHRAHHCPCGREPVQSQGTSPETGPPSHCSWPELKREHMAGIISGGTGLCSTSPLHLPTPVLFPAQEKLPSTQGNNSQHHSRTCLLFPAGCPVWSSPQPPARHQTAQQGDVVQIGDISRLHTEAWYLLHGLGPW